MIICGTNFCNQPKYRQQKTKVANAVHDECFFGGIIIIIVFKPKTNQQIRAQSNTLPSNKHDDIIASHYQQ